MTNEEFELRLELLQKIANDLTLRARFNSEVGEALDRLQEAIDMLNQIPKDSAYWEDS